MRSGLKGPFGGRDGGEHNDSTQQPKKSCITSRDEKRSVAI
jgi:hypothetical protein